MITFWRTEDGIKLQSSRNRALNSGIKLLIPKSKRRPVFVDNRFSHWLFAPDQESVLKKICEDMGENTNIVHAKHTIQGEQIKIFKILYIGQFKDRADGDVSAYGPGRS